MTDHLDHKNSDELSDEDYLEAIKGNLFVDNEEVSKAAGDSNNTITSEYSLQQIYKYSGFSSTIIDSFSTPSTFPFGVEYSTTGVLSADANSERVYKHSGFSSTISDSF